MTLTSINILAGLLALLILLSAFFSGAETGMMSLNRYRLRHLTRKNHRAAKRVSNLLARPDRLLSAVLIGNTCANIMAAAIATVIASHFFAETGVAIATFVLTLVILVFSEIIPKTFAALYPEKIAFLVALPLKVILLLIYPLVWIVNNIVNILLWPFGVRIKPRPLERLTHDELRTVVHEAADKIFPKHQEMLLGVLDLVKMTIDDVMVPRSDIKGIDLDDDWDTILNQLTNSEHTRLPIYKGSVNNVRGILHLRKALNILAQNRLNKDSILTITDTPYFVPEGTPLNMQLAYFQQQKVRLALVVDEYGDIKGLVTLEDILEEIVGEFTTSLAPSIKDMRRQKDGSYLVDGGLNLRDLNRSMHWHFPIEGPKTLSGIIVEHLEMLPDTGICLRIAGYPLEIIQVKDNVVKTARIWPKLRLKV